MTAALCAFALTALCAGIASQVRAARLGLRLRFVRVIAPVAAAMLVVPLAAVGSTLHDAALGVAMAACAVATWSDLECGCVFDVVTLPSALVVLCLVALHDAGAHVLAATIAAGCLYGLHLLTRGRGLGLGDVKLAAVFGLAMVPLCSLYAIGSAFMIGAIVSCTLLVARKIRRGAAIPFAPFLSSGAAFAFVIGAHT